MLGSRFRQLSIARTWGFKPEFRFWNRSRNASTARLVLQDGFQVVGKKFGYAADDVAVSGEVVFNTGMTGYNETLSDPSYKGQILILTYPLIGNYGSPSEILDQYGIKRYFESDHGPQITGLIVSEYSAKYSHWQASQSLSEWLEKHKIPAIEGVDTRLLTKRIREHGTMLGKLLDSDLDPNKFEFVDINSENLVKKVSRIAPRVYEPVVSRPDCHVVAVDCGMKNSILRNLLERNARVTVVPWDYDFHSLFLQNSGKYHGLFISNGPGDPSMCDQTIRNLKQFIADPSFTDIPIFGICMGHQLLSSAAGAKTYKLPFGHRSQNQPAQAINAFSNRCFITSQNHGFAVDADSLDINGDWRPLFVNSNDSTNEGIVHLKRPIFSVQFHPEARNGPTDTRFLFDVFLDIAKGKRTHVLDNKEYNYSNVTESSNVSLGEHIASGGNLGDRISFLNETRTSQSSSLVKKELLNPVRKVVLLGSGGLQIGQAGEFDYSGSQALKALKEEGIETVLINANIATVQTAIDNVSNAKISNSSLADHVYFLPVTPEFVEAVIERERPDSILLQFGGQTALNCGVALYNSGILQKYNVQILGTPVDTIVATEDREIFAEKLVEIGERIAPSSAATSVEAAVNAAEKIGYPVIVRAAFSLGGLGSGFAQNKAELKDLVSRALSATPQVMVEKSLKGWKELEYEIVRDKFDNTIAVCNMENFDPLGIHTGDSIVIAPSQTLNDVEYHMLREAAIRIVKHVGVIGECNVQFALDPKSLDYIIIEMNPRLSRSSALASKATGYPLAFVAAKLALGKSLVEITNSVNEQTKACFEPALDYVITKSPRWDLQKFDNVSRQLGSGMKSVGEVMSIGRNFEESFQKALRMVFSSDSTVPGFTSKNYKYSGESALIKELTQPTEQRVFAIAKALELGWSVDRIHELTSIDRWFLFKLEGICNLEKQLSSLNACESHGYVKELIHSAKRNGISDVRIAELLSNPDWNEERVRKFRIENNIVPSIKQIDTLAAEFPAKTNYLYSTYHGSEDDVDIQQNDPNHVLVLGGGGYRIGSSVEFDYGSVRCIQTIRGMNKKSSMINFNPETVSTDYDESDYLFFEELNLERVLDIHSKISPGGGTIISFGGQIPNNLAYRLFKSGVNLLGTSAVNIDRAEDRQKFSDLLDSLGISQPSWSSFTTSVDAKRFAKNVGYPVLVRPSYVLSGAGMEVAYDETQLDSYLSRNSSASSVVISKFMEDWLEVDFDGVASNGNLLVCAVSEHIERAGVHSGDASLVFPSPTLSQDLHKLIVGIGAKLAKGLSITGPFNSQLLIPLDKSSSEITLTDVKVIECNVRASRSLPFVSKAMGIDMAEIATRAMLSTDFNSNATIQDLFKKPEFGYYAVKIPQFSFTRLLGADPLLGVEMCSTGEVACFAQTVEEGFLKGLLAATFKMPSKTSRILLSTGSEKNKDAMLPYVKKLKDMGFEIYATPGTAQHLQDHGLSVETCYWDLGGGEDQGRYPKACALLQNKDIDLVINVPSPDKVDIKDEKSNCFLVRRAAVDHSVPLITNLHVAQKFISGLESTNFLSIEKYSDLKEIRAKKCQA